MNTPLNNSLKPVITKMLAYAGAGATLLLAVAMPPTAAVAAGTATGYSGTQTFVTAAGKDPSEPNACGVIGGASYWFSYQPPTNGIATFNTSNTAFNTVLGVYVDDGRNLGYSSLVSVTCNDNATNTVLWSSVTWPASKLTNYFIMFDGVNGAYGTAYLNYNLNAYPSVTTIANKTVNEDTSTGAIAFTVGDKETAVGSLVVSATSSNTALVATTNIILAGTTASRTISITPITNKFGTTLITLTVKDAAGATTNSSFLLTVTAVNDAPKAVSDTVTRLPGQSITIARAFPVRNDTDVDSTNLTVTAVAALSKNGKAITLNSTNIIYAANTTTNQDYFTYTVSDGALTATGTNYINVGTNGVLIVN